VVLLSRVVADEVALELERFGPALRAGLRSPLVDTLLVVDLADLAQFLFFDLTVKESDSGLNLGLPFALASALEVDVFSLVNITIVVDTVVIAIGFVESGVVRLGIPDAISILGVGLASAGDGNKSQSNKSNSELHCFHWQ